MPTCPKCTGHYGGFDTRKSDDGTKIIVTNTWRCHCDVNGGDLSTLEWIDGELKMKPKGRWPAKPCGNVFEVTEDA